MKKGVARTPSGRFKKWFNHSSNFLSLTTDADGLGEESSTLRTGGLGATALGAGGVGAATGVGEVGAAGAGENKSVNLDIVIKNFLIIY